MQHPSYARPTKTLFRPTSLKLVCLVVIYQVSFSKKIPWAAGPDGSVTMVFHKDLLMHQFWSLLDRQVQTQKNPNTQHQELSILML